MTLTGPGFLALTATVTVAAFVGAVLVWPRLATPGVQRVAARVGVLAGINALVILLAATALNDQFEFYADWTDLLGAVHTGTAATVTHAGAVTPLVARAPTRPVHPVASAVPLPAGGSPNNRVLRFTVTGRRSGVTGGVVVAFPPSYFSAANRTRRYPVLEAFHGYPGGPDQWVDSMGLPAELERQSAAGRVAEAIVIMPTIQIPAGRDTECVNGRPTDPQMETWLSEDLPDWAAQSLRVQPARTSWATIGFSVGGWCAAMATMLHPDRFSAAAVLGGYFSPQFGGWKPFGPRSAAAAHYNLVALARRQPPPVAIWAETSHSDPISYPSTQAFLRAAKPPLSVEAVVLKHAGHRLGLWKAYLPTVLDWLATTVPGFRPGA